MAGLKCKVNAKGRVTVRFKRFTRANLRILTAVYEVAEKTTSVRDIVITSANDGRHSRRPLSQHYKDAAVDIRTHSFRRVEARRRFQGALTHELGPLFYVVYEGRGTRNAHIHVQQRKGTTYTGKLA